MFQEIPCIQLPFLVFRHLKKNSGEEFMLWNFDQSIVSHFLSFRSITLVFIYGYINETRIGFSDL